MLDSGKKINNTKLVCLFVGNPCDSSPCQNGAQCSPGIDAGTFVCTCPSGSEWTGDLCTIQGMLVQN
jgi:hypothetical protein